MPRPSRHALSPVGLVVDTVSIEGDRVLVSAHPISLDAACTGCGQRSARIHSRYERQLQDLPALWPLRPVAGSGAAASVRQCRLQAPDLR